MVLFHEKQQNAASTKPAAQLNFWWVLLASNYVFSLTKRLYMWLRVNLTRSHIPKQPLIIDDIIRKIILITPEII